MKNQRIYCRIAICSVIAAVLAGCATKSRESLEQKLVNESMQRWEFVAEGDWTRAYETLSPAYRAAVSENNYIKNMSAARIKWKSGKNATIGECELDAENLPVQCDVLVDVTYEVSKGVPGVRSPLLFEKQIRENWLRTKNTWYLVPDRIR